MKKQTLTKLAASLVFSIVLSAQAYVAGCSLANGGTVSDSAIVSMVVGKFAAISQLDGLSFLALPHYPEA